MIKKLICSTMVLSFAIMPLSTALAEDVTVTIPPDQTLAGTTAWAPSTKYSNTGGTGGTLTLNGYTGQEAMPETITQANYVQSGADSVLALTGGNSRVSLWGIETDAATISAGQVNIGADGSEGSSLTLEITSQIQKAVKVNLGVNNTITIANAAGFGEPSLVLDAGTGTGDTWNGTIVNGVRKNPDDPITAGILQLDGFTERGDEALLNMEGGNLTLIGGSTLTLDHDGDYISGGSVTIGTTGASASTGNNLIISTAKSGDRDYTLTKNVRINLKENNTLTITNNGSAIISGGTTGDDWGGTVNVTGGELTLDGVDITTDTAIKYTQSAGVLNLGNTETDVKKSAAQSKLNLAAGSSITGGTSSTVNMAQNSTLTLNNGTTNSFKLTTTGDTTTAANTLVVGDGTTETTYNAANGTTISKNAVVTLNGKSTLGLGTGTDVTLSNNSSALNDTWNGTVNVTGGKLTLDGFSTRGNSAVLQMNSGNLNLIGESTFALGNTGDYIAGGEVAIGTSGESASTGNNLIISAAKSGTRDYTLGKEAKVTINSNNTLTVAGSGSVVLDSSTSDTWNGIIKNTGGNLVLDAYSSTNADAIYQQTAGTLTLNEVARAATGSSLALSNTSSYINGGNVNLLGTKETEYDEQETTVLNITTAATGQTATLGKDAVVNMADNSMIILSESGNAILNDIGTEEPITNGDTWDGVAWLFDSTGTGGENPTLTLENVTKDFSSTEETGHIIQSGGTLNLTANANGGSYIIYNEADTRYIEDEDTYEQALLKPYVVVNGDYDDSGKLIGVTEKEPAALGKINIQGYTDGTKVNVSALQLNYSADSDSIAPILTKTTMKGYSGVVLNTNGYTLTHSDVVPKSEGTGNSLMIAGNGSYIVNRPNEDDTTFGYNLIVADGSMTVNTPNNLVIGTADSVTGDTLTGDLTIGTEGAENKTYFTTKASNNLIYGNMKLYNGIYTMQNANAYTHVNGNMYTGSGINMMAGAINKIDVDGHLNIDNLDMKIDIDPQRNLTDTINAETVAQNGNLNLSEYNLLSQPTKERYTFKVVNASNDNNYTLGSNSSTSVSAGQTVETEIGYYTMMPSSVKGAFDLALTGYKSEIFRGQVMADVVYANQLVVSNMLFDRMLYSNLPYFNGECSNKTASANTLFSPYQYTTNDTGLWFKPYGNFETIRMTEGIEVNNNAYGALIGVDFKKKNFGKGWSFIPTAYVAYNGGYSKYSGTSMWHNGGQGGFMGTFTKKNFVTGLEVYGGGYGASYNLPYGATDGNGLWNVGVASKTAYNINLPWHFILQPSVYLAYNYVGASNINTSSGLNIKVDPLNAFNVAPGLNLIWQRETFSIYAMFQAMFNVNGGASGSIADITLPQVAMRDPYFEYGLGVTKFFKDRFSAYAQGTARSGSRTGFGFQLGMNMKI